MPWSRGRPLTWDFTCVHTLCASHLRVTGGQPGEAARLAEIKKLTKYSSCSSNVQFVPVAVETLGVPGPSAAAFLSELGRRQVDALKDPRAAAQLMQLQRGNALCILETLRH